jgi:hypothetical protein
MAELLKGQYGALGVVTQSVLDTYAGPLGLDSSSAASAARTAGLTIVEASAVSENPPMQQYDSFEAALGAAGVDSVVALMHPVAGGYRLLGRYENLDDPTLRLDGEAVAERFSEAERRGTSASDNALRGVLQILRSAVQARVEPREIALFHLTKVGTRFVALGPVGVRDQLVKLGLVPDEAAVLAVVLTERQHAAGAGSEAKVASLLAEGRLREAQAAAQSLPAESARKKEILADLEVAAVRLADLLDQARVAIALPDEVRAESLLRDARMISEEEAEVVLATVPLPPPQNLRVASDADVVRLHWQPNAGHDEATSYQISRSEQQAPLSPAEGTPLGKQAETDLVDPRPLVARTVHYSVFALEQGRPASRPASASTTVLPPVGNVSADVGPTEVLVHWSSHPDVEFVEAVRREPGAQPVQLDVRSNSTKLTGLGEGEAVHFEITAIYRGPDGAPLRAEKVAINATPRSEAKPLTALKARAIDAGGEVRVQVSWLPVDHSDVRIVASRTPSNWPVGAKVTADDMTRFGTELSGSSAKKGSQQSLVAELSAGVHHLVPFSVGGSGIVVGKGTAVGITDPVTDLVVTPMGQFAKLAWAWPATSQLAEVVWESGDDADAFQVNQHKYRTEGVKVPLGSQATRVEVRALLVVNSETFAAPPATAEVAARGGKAKVGYTVRSSPSLGGFGGRTKKVTFTSADGCAGARVRVIASAGPVMPLSADDGFPVHEGVLNLRPDTPVVVDVTVPKSIPRPYWVRGFIVSGDAQLVDPPPNTLKEG